MGALPIADLTATATLILAGIALALAIATVALVVVTRQGTARAQAELRLLERQVASGYRPLLVDVISTAPPPPDMGALYNISRSEGPNRVTEYPGPVIETRFPGHEPALFDPRTAFVSLEADKIHLSVPLRNVGRGLAVIDGDGVEVTGPLVGALEYRAIQRPHVPVGETTRVDMITGYLREQGGDLGEQGHTFVGIAWELSVPYHDFAGEQRTVARLRLICRGDDGAGPWRVERVEQESPGDQERLSEDLRDTDPAPRTAKKAPRLRVREEPVVDLWGNPVGPRRRKR